MPACRRPCRGPVAPTAPSKLCCSCMQAIFYACCIDIVVHHPICSARTASAGCTAAATHAVPSCRHDRRVGVGTRASPGLAWPHLRVPSTAAAPIIHKKHQGWPAHGETGGKGCKLCPTFAGRRRQGGGRRQGRSRRCGLAVAAIVRCCTLESSRIGAPAAGAARSGRQLGPHLERAGRPAGRLNDATDSNRKLLIAAESPRELPLARGATARGGRELRRVDPSCVARSQAGMQACRAAGRMSLRSSTTRVVAHCSSWAPRIRFATCCQGHWLCRRQPPTQLPHRRRCRLPPMPPPACSYARCTAPAASRVAPPASQHTRAVCVCELALLQAPNLAAAWLAPREATHRATEHW